MKVFPLQSTRNNFKIKACSCSSSDRLGVGRPASSIASLISGRASWPKGFSAPTPFSSSHHSPPIFRHDLFSAPLPPATTKLSAALLAGPDKVILLSWLVEVSGLCSDEWDILYLAPPPPTLHVQLKDCWQTGGGGFLSSLSGFSIITSCSICSREMTSTPLGGFRALRSWSDLRGGQSAWSVTEEHIWSRKDRKKILTGPQGAFWMVTVNFPERRLLTRTYWHDAGKVKIRPSKDWKNMSPVTEHSPVQKDTLLPSKFVRTASTLRSGRYSHPDCPPFSPLERWQRPTMAGNYKNCANKKENCRQKETLQQRKRKYFAINEMLWIKRNTCAKARGEVDHWRLLLSMHCCEKTRAGYEWENQRESEDVSVGCPYVNFLMCYLVRPGWTSNWRMSVYCHFG